MEAAKRHYPVDDRRIAIRGFSMGGAGCWHLAVHHADQWVAATPGAGFAESAEYLGLWKKEIKPLWFETQLWRLYDADVYATNLFHLPTLAYSGGNDKQIQAAQVMEKAMAEHGMDLAHLIGPETGHAYHPQSKEELVARHRDMVRQGKEVMPTKVRLTTFTLRYPEMHWVRLEGLQRHWHRARVEAEIRNESEIELLSENVSALTLHMPAGSRPLASDKAPVVSLDGQRVVAPRVGSDRSWKAHFVKKEGNGKGSRIIPCLQGSGVRNRACKAPSMTPSWIGLWSSSPAARPGAAMRIDGLEERWGGSLNNGAHNSGARPSRCSISISRMMLFKMPTGFCLGHLKPMPS